MPSNIHPPFNPYKKKSHFLRHIITTLVLVLVSFVAGFYFAPKNECIQQKVGTSLLSEKCSNEEASQVDLNPAEETFPEEVIIDPDKKPLNSFGGVIKSIEGNNVMLESNMAALGVFEQGVATKTVTITNQTIIEKREPKPASQFEREFQDYRKAMMDYRDLFLENPELASEAELIERPVDYVVAPGTVSDLKTGDSLKVSATVDIRTNDSFEATFIEIIPMLQKSEDELEEGGEPFTDGVLPSDLGDELDE